MPKVLIKIFQTAIHNVIHSLDRWIPDLKDDSSNDGDLLGLLIIYLQGFPRSSCQMSKKSNKLEDGI